MVLLRWVLLATVFSTSCLWAGDLQELVRDFDRDFASVLDEEEIPGGAWAVVQGGRVVGIGTRGHTDTTGSQPVNPSTIFRIASVSKGFAGTLAAVLAAEGEFDWSDPIVQFKPQFPANGASRAITVGDVVGQSTGYTPHAFDNLIEAGVSLPEIYSRFGELHPVCQPGTCYTYQNSAFALIEPVVESVAGTRYPETLGQRIFTPLGMNTASVGYEAYMANNNRAHPHVQSRGQWRTVSVKPTYYAINSAAGVNASIVDMSLWLIAKLGHRPEVLSPGVIEEVTRARVRTPRNINRRYWRDHISDAHYGLGWRIYQFGQHELVYHGGWVSGFRADAAFSPAHDLGLVILLNAESNAISELSTRFWARAFDGLSTELVHNSDAPGGDLLEGSGTPHGIAIPGEQPAQ